MGEYSLSMFLERICSSACKKIIGKVRDRVELVDSLKLNLLMLNSKLSRQILVANRAIIR